MFGDLFDRNAARATLAGLGGGFAAALTGIVSASPGAVAFGGVAISCAGVLATANLALGPRRVTRPHAPETRMPTSLTTTGSTP
jgi:hypothetical protein